ncbi:MAG: cyclic lactone autoinducer peptide [Oscillospiraceae bacterium]|jgi:cyclic lactone autoinducer peptide|nr:cyclic lactone autoinducer peptide [Oscillospiraceae bacterium]
MKVKQIIADCILKIAEKSAKVACGSVSVLGFNQPKEPENLEEKLKQFN